MVSVASDDVLQQRWAAMESNPEVLSKLCTQLGTGEGWGVCDVYGLDDDCLGFVPQPVAALILLFPSRDAEGERPAPVMPPPHAATEGVWYTRQLRGTLDNACGTIAVAHGLINQREKVGLREDSPLMRFYRQTAADDPNTICHKFGEDTSQSFVALTFGVFGRRKRGAGGYP